MSLESTRLGGSWARLSMARAMLTLADKPLAAPQHAESYPAGHQLNARSLALLQPQNVGTTSHAPPLSQYILAKCQTPSHSTPFPTTTALATSLRNSVLCRSPSPSPYYTTPSHPRTQRKNRAFPARTPPVRSISRGGGFSPLPCLWRRRLYLRHDMTPRNLS
jgi:hypothetical protein